MRRRAANSGSFASGGTPWNKGLRGIHLSPKTEWKKGQPSDRKMPLGSVTIRHRKREPHPRAFIKVAEPNTWLPRTKWVWERANGSVPKGMVIHHKDRDPLNDDLSNLVLLTRSEHAREHNHELHDARYGRAGKTFTGIEHNPKHFETAVRRISAAFEEKEGSPQ